MTVQIMQPLPTFNDINGRPLDDGFIFIGQDGLDPVANQIPVFWDFALTQPATQPIRTISGYPSNNGVRAEIFTGSNAFSILVRNKNGTTVFSQLSATQLAIDLANNSDPAKGVALVGNAVARADTATDLRGRTNTGENFIVEQPAGNPQAFVDYFKTGVIDIGKAGQSMPPYIYDQAGAEYIERRPIGIHEIPQVVLDSVPKILVQSPFVATTHMIVVPKRESEYLLIGMQNNVTTTAESLATSASDTTMRRVTNIQNAVSVVIGQKDTYVEGGVWTNQSLGSVPPEVPAFTSSSAYTYKQTNTTGSTLTFTAIPYNGFISLSFICSASSNPAAEITVDGTLFTVSLVSATTAIKTLRFPAYKQSVSVVINNASPGPVYFINFLGRDFSTLALWDGAPINAWGYYRNSAQADYLVNNSENDYVIREFVSNTYGGGYHGGEAAITDAYTVDGVATTPSSTPVIGKKITLKSTCTIDWTPAGSAVSVAVRKRYDFTAGGYFTQVGVDGNITCKEFYSALFGANETFSKLDAPSPADLITGLPNNERLLVGRTSQIQVRHPTTGQLIIANYTVHQNDSATQYGGAFIWRVDGSYKKLYYATAHAGKLAITGNYSRNRYEFV